MDLRVSIHTCSKFSQNGHFNKIICLARGVFYLDSGHSFDNVLFYGNDFALFQYELMIFVWIFVMTNSYIAGILGVAGFQQVQIASFFLSNFCFIV